MSPTIFEAYQQAFDAPDRALNRLYELAKRDQWNAESLPWDQIDFSQVPLALREALAGLYTQVHYGEIGSLLGAARAVAEAPNLTARLFASTQVMDEARHVEWFTRLIQKLDCRAPVHDAVIEFVSEVAGCDTAEERMIGMQLMVEGLAQSLFIEGGRMVRALDVAQPAQRPLAGVATVLGDWMVNYIGRDESRHVAFGVLHVAQRLKELPAPTIDALQRKAERWGSLIVAIAASAEPRFGQLGIDASSLARRCVEDLNERLRRAGLEVRLPVEALG